MNGQVLAHHALLNVTFRLQGQPDLEIECVIDTGFIGYLTFPLAAAQAMNLPFIRRMPANLAQFYILLGVDGVMVGGQHLRHR